MTLLDLIKQASKSKPITRQQIAFRLGISDRIARKRIEALRETGERICSGPATKRGYYYAKTEEEYQEFRKRYILSALRIMHIIEQMDKGGEQA